MSKGSAVLDQEDVDRLLLRRLSLQRYVTGLYQDVLGVSQPFDRRLIALINQFMLEASDKSLSALAAYRSSDEPARTLVRTIRALVLEQAHVTQDYVSAQMAQLLEREVGFVSSVIKAPSAASAHGLASMPVVGRLQGEIVTTVFVTYLTRLLADLSSAAAQDPRDMSARVQGRRSENFRNGVLYWRNNRLLKPQLSVLVNGNSANAHIKAYRDFDITSVSWLATLDFRTCPTCYAAESGSPYTLGRQPRHPAHPFCRCLIIPADPGVSTERPFVRDTRPVAQIPKGERAGRVGTTRDTIEQFFARMNQRQREEYMGKRRAGMWARGQITDLKQLVDARTLRPLSLEHFPGES